MTPLLIQTPFFPLGNNYGTIASHEVASFPSTPISPSKKSAQIERATSAWNDDDDCPTSPVMSPLHMQIVHTQSLPLLAMVKTITVNSSETNGTINVDGNPLENLFRTRPQWYHCLQWISTTEIHPLGLPPS